MTGRKYFTRLNHVLVHVICFSSALWLPSSSYNGNISWKVNSKPFITFSFSSPTFKSSNCDVYVYCGKECDECTIYENTMPLNEGEGAMNQFIAYIPCDAKFWIKVKPTNCEPPPNFTYGNGSPSCEEYVVEVEISRKQFISCADFQNGYGNICNSAINMMQVKKFEEGGNSSYYTPFSEWRTSASITNNVTEDKANSNKNKSTNCRGNNKTSLPVKDSKVHKSGTYNDIINGSQKFDINSFQKFETNFVDEDCATGSKKPEWSQFWTIMYLVLSELSIAIFCFAFYLVYTASMKYRRRQIKRSEDV